MNPVPAVAGAVAVGGLLVAWRRRVLAPLFLAAGGGACALAFLAMLLRRPASAAFLAMLAVPYWASWLFVYTLGSVQPRAGGGPVGSDTDDRRRA